MSMDQDKPTGGNPPPPSDADAQLDDCLRGLRGEAPMALASAAHQFGAQLRERLVSEDAAVKPTPNAADEALIARWRAEGVFRGKPEPAARAARSTAPARPAWRDAWRWWLPTSAIALLSLWLWPWGQQAAWPPAPGEDEATRMRGAEQAQRLSVASPTQTANQLAEVFQRHSLRASQRQMSDGTVQVQALVPPTEVAARESLQAMGVSVPVHGRLDLLIVPQP